MPGRQFPYFVDRRELVIIGTGGNADMAYECFKKDSCHIVKAFAVEREYLDSGEKFGLPVLPFENLEDILPPDRYAAFVAVGYAKLNRLRARLYGEAKAKGYDLLSYVSSQAFVWDNVKIGDNCLILEDNVLQYDVEIGNNTWLWSGNHVGHCAKIGNHVFIASHVVISGSCEIGDYCFCGVNSAFANDIMVGRNCVVGMGANVKHDVPAGSVLSVPGARRGELDDLPPSTRAHFHPEGK